VHKQIIVTCDAFTCGGYNDDDESLTG